MFIASDKVLSIDFKGSRAHIAMDKATYSASIVDRAIADWILLLHTIGTPPIVKSYPVLDLTKFGSSQSL
jgi:hypothetical protein